MELHFCDLCNESVPQRDLDQGRAFLRKGRVVCAACDHAMGGHGAAEAARAASAGLPLGQGLEAAAAETALGLDAPVGAAAAPVPAIHHVQSAPAGSGLAMVLAAMGILLTASVAVLLFERLDDSSRDSSIELGRMRGELRAGLDDIRDDMDAGERMRSDELRRLGTELAALGARADERERSDTASVGKLAAEVADLAERLGETAALADRVAEQDRRASEVAATIAVMGGDIRLIAEKVIELEERPIAVAAPEMPADDGGLDPIEPEWMQFVADLSSPSFNARYAAVTALGDTNDPAVVPHLVPMLRDSDLFVRMATARVLGDLRSMEGVEALIDALEDEEPSVREQAVVSLRSLTNKAFGFDPTGNQAERSKKIKSWRDWWRRNGTSAGRGVAPTTG